ncbi:MAG TPA: hypothetical protein VLJ59_08370 [Mycobacteriales bacterium]|nr:hypothetical protein [Mycobacteriales bacterium]
MWGIDLKAGMELRPWAGCLQRLATTPDQAQSLLAQAVTELDRRAALLAETGHRQWTPTPDTPALVILIDEYAELGEPARQHADSLARRGRAVAVTLLAATQRPTQAAMGHGATRSQMDARICLRVRERRDTDLILGQGAHTAGWHAVHAAVEALPPLTDEHNLTRHHHPGARIPTGARAPAHHLYTTYHCT